MMLTVIVPALNEENRIIDSVNEVIAAVQELSIEYELILVDDGSIDLTWEKMQSLQNSNKRVRAIKNFANLGIGASYKVGLSYASGDFVTWVPADLSHKKASLLDAYSVLDSADIIIPLPNNPHVRSLKRQLISKIFTFFINVGSGLSVPYYNGLSVHKRTLLERIEIHSTGFGFQAEIIVKLIKQGATYRIVNTFIDERKEGKSKALTCKNFTEVAKTSSRIFIG